LEVISYGNVGAVLHSHAPAARR